MLIGICTVQLYLQGINSLKEKRGIIKSVIHRVRHRYNISVAEVDNQDLWQRATIGLGKVGTEQGHIHRELTNIVDYIEQTSDAELVDYEIEIL